MSLNHFIAFYLGTFLIWSQPASSDTFGAIPDNSQEYEKIFGHSPSAAEMEAIDSLRADRQTPYEKISSLKEFSNRLEQAAPLIILIGHNEGGQFKFSSGESESISVISKMIDASNKVGVFLTCKGACYTDAPAPNIRVSLKDALRIAFLIESRFGNFDQNTSPITPMPSEPVSPTTQNIAPLNAKQCSAIFLAARSPNSAHSAMTGMRADKMAFSREIRRVINKAEITSVVKSSAKLVAGLSSGSLLYFILDAEE